MRFVPEILRQLTVFHRLKGAALQREKLKDYRNVVSIQAIVLVLIMTLEDIVNLTGIVGAQQYVFLLFMGFAGLYLLLLWDMLKNFTSSMLILRGALFVLLVMFVLGVMGENPYKRLLPEPRPFYIFIHTNLVMIQTYVMILAVLDIFTGNRLTSDKLWGSACVYMMAGFAFGDIYDLLNLIAPGCFGTDIAVGFPSYLAGVFYSFSTLGGLDAGYPQQSRLVHNISVIQSVLANLYLVFLIGRILGMSSESKSSDDEDEHDTHGDDGEYGTSMKAKTSEALR
jgi:hypothetical protein